MTYREWVKLPETERRATAVLLVLLVIASGFLLFHGVQDWRTAWKTNHWKVVACTVSEAELKVTAQKGGGAMVGKVIACDFTWEGRPVAIRETTAYDFTDQEVREGLAKWEEHLADLRDTPRRGCLVNPENPKETSLTGESYFGPGASVIASAALMAGCAFGAFRVLKPRRTPMWRGFQILRDLGIMLLTLALGGVFIIDFLLKDPAELEARLRNVPCTMVASGTYGPLGANPGVLFHYEWGGHTFHANRLDFQKSSPFFPQEVLDRYPAGSSRTCWVDPYEPWKAVLEKTFETRRRQVIFSVLFALPSAFALGIWLCRGFRFPSRKKLPEALPAGPKGVDRDEDSGIS